MASGVTRLSGCRWVSVFWMQVWLSGTMALRGTPDPFPHQVLFSAARRRSRLLLQPRCRAPFAPADAATSTELFLLFSSTIPAPQKAPIPAGLPQQCCCLPSPSLPNPCATAPPGGAALLMGTAAHRAHLHVCPAPLAVAAPRTSSARLSN